MKPKNMKTMGKCSIMVIIQLQPVAVVKYGGSGGMVGAADFASSFCGVGLTVSYHIVNCLFLCDTSQAPRCNYYRAGNGFLSVSATARRTGGY